MRDLKLTGTQIADEIKWSSVSFPMSNICRGLGISMAIFYQLNAKYGRKLSFEYIMDKISLKVNELHASLHIQKYFLRLKKCVLIFVGLVSCENWG